MVIFCIAVPWALTLYFSEPKHHKDINQKFLIFIGIAAITFTLLALTLGVPESISLPAFFIAIYNFQGGIF
jgi:hypothetical protein